MKRILILMLVLFSLSSIYSGIAPLNASVANTTISFTEKQTQEAGVLGSSQAEHLGEFRFTSKNILISMALIGVYILFRRRDTKSRNTGI